MKGAIPRYDNRLSFVMVEVGSQERMYRHIVVVYGTLFRRIHMYRINVTNP